MRKLERNYAGYFNAVKVGDYRISIQGSIGHYCSPKRTLDSDEYYSMEVGIAKKDGSSLAVRMSSVFRDFPRWKEFESCLESVPYSWVAGWVNVDLIEDLLCYLEDRCKKL